ncbi:unnamed protein product [Protopolystoma xenopodis]|uniref:Uncharacterized protein n=1 Tax=Protopolystoma xenopodis TaxID=117903 RepID=A0A3S5BAP8_9PLAT|nr:unnamed protein product [Protopolystoma xenopodis]
MNKTELDSLDFEGCLYTGYPGIGWAALHVAQSLPSSGTILSESVEVQHKRLLTRINEIVEAGCSKIDKRERKPSIRYDYKLGFIAGYPGVLLLAAMFYHVSLDLLCFKNEFSKVIRCPDFATSYFYFSELHI